MNGGVAFFCLERVNKEKSIALGCMRWHEGFGWLHIVSFVTLAKQVGCPSTACSASASGSGMHKRLREHLILAEKPAALLKSIFIICSLSIPPKQASGPFAASSSPLKRWPEGLFPTCKGVLLT